MKTSSKSSLLQLQWGKEGVAVKTNDTCSNKELMKDLDEKSATLGFFFKNQYSYHTEDKSTCNIFNLKVRLRVTKYLIATAASV